MFEVKSNISFDRGEGSRGGGNRGEGGDVRRVVFMEEREEERYGIQSITFQEQVSVSLSNQLYCIVG